LFDKWNKDIQAWMQKSTVFTKNGYHGDVALLNGFETHKKQRY
jgi:hypothetical protein